MFTTVAFTVLFVPSFLGQEELNIISPSEVRASEWFYYHARPNSVLVLAAPGFPFRYGGTYPEYLGPEGDANPNLLSETVFVGQELGPVQVPYVVARIEEYAKHGYIVFDKDETTYAEVFRLTPPGALGRLENAVARSPDFRLWYDNKVVRIYELMVRPSTRRRPKIGKLQLHNRLLSSNLLVKQLEFRKVDHRKARVGKKPRHRRTLNVEE